MISIDESVIEHADIEPSYPPDSIELKTVKILLASEKKYYYNTIDQLKFELELRKEIVESSIRLNNSSFSFATFRKSRCNNRYWKRTDEGGFLLKNDTSASESIRDIYVNGRKYATECATAIIIIIYGAVQKVYPPDLFDRLFSRIYLMDWQHIDNSLGIKYYTNRTDHLPGDCRYFKNPDVDPLTPEWQGENAIDLGNKFYYGHGIGIMTAEGIINVLNKHRIPGSETSAYLLNSATLPNFNQLYKEYINYSPS